MARVDDHMDTNEEEIMPRLKGLRQNGKALQDQYEVEGGIWPNSQSDSDSDWESARSLITAPDTNMMRRFRDVYNHLKSLRGALGIVPPRPR